jgi:hypothetical protein
VRELYSTEVLPPFNVRPVDEDMPAPLQRGNARRKRGCDELSKKFR